MVNPLVIQDEINAARAPTTPPPEQLPAPTPSAPQDAPILHPATGPGVVFPVDGFDATSGKFGQGIGADRGRGPDSLHEGVDLAAPAGTTIRSTVDGVVESVAVNKLGGFTVKIRDSNGNSHYYAHMLEQSPLKQGARVSAGDALGKVGSSGNAQGTPPHLHYSVKTGSGQIVDPIRLLKENLWLSVDKSGNVLGSSPPPAITPGAGAQPSTVAPPNLPGGGQIYQLDDGTAWAVYDFFDLDGPKIGFEITGALGEHNLPVNEVSAAEFDGMNVVEGGDATELDAVAREFPGAAGFQEMVNSTLDRVLGNNPARADKGVLEVIFQFIARPDMGDTERQRLLESTEYYQARTERQLGWNDKTAAQQEFETQREMSNLQNLWFTYTGEFKPTEDFRADALRVASGELGVGQWTAETAKTAAGLNPESPWSRTKRNEEIAQNQFAVDKDDATNIARTQAHRWGVQLSESSLREWGNRLAFAEVSEDDLEEYLKQQAQVLYAWKDPEMRTDQAAEPWIQTHRRLLEKEADIFNPHVQRALSLGTNMVDFERELKGTEEWLNTKNAKETFTNEAVSIGRRMGFV